MRELAIRISTDGTCTQVSPATGDRFTLEELQDVVGGYIERVFAFDGAIMWVNEDGLRLGLPTNLLATLTIHPFTLVAPGGIRGDVLLMITQLPELDED